MELSKVWHKSVTLKIAADKWQLIVLKNSDSKTYFIGWKTMLLGI